MSAAMELALAHVTPANVAIGVAWMMMSAGMLHALPGRMQKCQATAMGMPAWFLFCAGLLMLSCGALYWLRPAVGLYAVALSMGGAAATAAKMPNAMHRPGGLVFSSACLGAALWAACKETGEVSPLTLSLCAMCYAVGIAGRIFLPTNPLAIKLLGLSISTKKEDEALKAEVEKPKDEAEAGAAEGAKPGETSTESTMSAQQESSGARKRVSSPAPARTTAHAGA